MEYNRRKQTIFKNVVEGIRCLKVGQLFTISDLVLISNYANTYTIRAILGFLKQAGYIGNTDVSQAGERIYFVITEIPENIKQLDLKK